MKIEDKSPVGKTTTCMMTYYILFKEHNTYKYFIIYFGLQFCEAEYINFIENLGKPIKYFPEKIIIFIIDTPTYYL